MPYDNFRKQEAGRKRLARLLGIAPFRVDVTLLPTGVTIEIDGSPASLNQMQTFWDDVASVLSAGRNLLS